MTKFKTGLLATVISISFAASAAVPVEAASIYVPQPAGLTGSMDVINVAGRGDGRHYYPRRKIYRKNIHRHHDRANYWRGHRGYKHYRRGYRRHGDLWFPLAAFAAGAIISGAIANDRAPAYSGNSHVQWCYDHYRSYRASDDTYQPYNGPRKLCRSPY